MIISRHSRLRPAICTGRQASGISASMKSGSAPPHPRVHAAHGSADYQPQMIHLQALCQQRVLRHHHVVIVVLRKVRVQAVAWFARSAVADAVRQDEVVAAGIERLALAEQHPGEPVHQKALCRTAGGVQDEHRVVDPALGIAVRSPESHVMQSQLRQRLAGGEAKVRDDVVAFRGCQRSAFGFSAHRVRREPKTCRRRAMHRGKGDYRASLGHVRRSSNDSLRIDVGTVDSASERTQ